MDAVQPAVRRASHDQPHGEGTLSRTLSTRPRAGIEREALRSGTSPQRPSENQSSASLPRGFEGMLKTTTETGDIGMFSIKPSRVPQTLGTPRRSSAGYKESGPQRPRHNFEPYGVPVVDDRRRLPSYARDAASEVISMYETASQKTGSRVFDEPDYRSYSMTQTSYSSYTLSNHRSYASLRSQADGSNPVQRPRSPFAYPTRLKRPGFRPSSPALTDGGLVDYSRRAEIERIPKGSGHSTSSPSSLYAQRRRPNHPMLRHDANRSTPSLLSQPSPHRRSSSPLAPQPNGYPSHDWSRRGGPASVNTSPARSTFSLASTVNLYSTLQPPSTTTTPGKVPSSPLYYDYTEDFEVEVHTEAEAREPPPLFRIDKTIPEDRPMSSERLPTEPPSPQDTNSTGFTAADVMSRKSSARISSDGVPKRKPTPSDLREHAIAAGALPVEVETISSPLHTEDSQVGKTLGLSGLGYGAQQLGNHVDEVFGIFPGSAFEITDPNKGERDVAAQSQIDQTPDNGHGRDVEAQSARASYSAIINIPSFPLPSQDQSRAEVPFSPLTETKDFVSSSSLVESLQSPAQLPQSSTRQDYGTTETISSEILDTDIKAQNPATSSTVEALSTQPNGRSGLGGRIKNTDAQDTPASMPSLRRTHMASPDLPGESRFREKSIDGGAVLPKNIHRRRAEDGRAIPQIRPLKRSQNYSGDQKLELSSLTDDVPNFSHQIPKKTVARSESPMLAPKPISPARQLKLKNSVPQLMKALPPLPPEPSSWPTFLPDVPSSEENELPDKFPPLQPEIDRAVIQKSPGIHAKAFLVNYESDLNKGLTAVERVPAQRPPEEKTEPLGAPDYALPHPRLKLKIKSSSQRSVSPPDSRPWNIAENYTWSTRNPSVRLPQIAHDPLSPSSKTPKFRLKVIRASNSSQGTALIISSAKSVDIFIRGKQAAAAAMQVEMKKQLCHEFQFQTRHLRAVLQTQNPRKLHRHQQILIHSGPPKPEAFSQMTARMPQATIFYICGEDFPIYERESLLLMP
ncbi:hypothetical protein LZ554_002679 [Drepanopeziza brunnea f. sp. 'monogermtubi']|nr:hypothetical protein LZ554_002679 [Drepanopeziza brunnea f. sp. 'monogermtubi']